MGLIFVAKSANDGLPEIFSVDDVAAAEQKFVAGEFHPPVVIAHLVGEDIFDRLDVGYYHRFFSIEI